ncbi:DsbA family protein [Geomesophilobacter sediminis]|uniref:DsbA family protein n=1 Tax=Geomesophilobacter sediminis TaxID=2798584 RepID=A0A8J7M202_9BACT|nr:DsbA family protein [Geomesophilobacter sediminis]MBJ6727157.1 DsbA family protein [Geomesophilobacter sediminis]
MFCIAALLILSVLGIFSARYRSLAKDALDCVLRRVTLRPCITGFDEKMKSRILGRVINRSERAARFLNRNFELLAWVFFILVLGSTVYAARGLYLFYVTGSCNGLNQESFCVFDPKGENNEVTDISQGCKENPPTAADLTLKGVDLSRFPVCNPAGKKEIVLIGCYGCSYTRKIYAPLKELAAARGARFRFLDYPVKVSTTLSARLAECVYRRDEARYWQLNDILFAAAPEQLDDPEFAGKAAMQLGLDWGDLGGCVEDPAVQALVDRRMDEIAKTRFYGTPTVFIGNQVFVGPKPRRVYAIALDGLFYWLKGDGGSRSEGR